MQGLLFALIVFGPRTAPVLPAWSDPYAASRLGGGNRADARGRSARASRGCSAWVGQNLTALPYPRDESTLVVTGPYRLVRNPIYSGLIFAAFGYALWVNGWLTLVYALALFILFDLKSRKEECWLAEKFSDYAAYQQRVKKLIPWVY